MASKVLVGRKTVKAGSGRDRIVIKRAWLFSASMALTFFALGGLIAWFAGMVIAPLALRVF